MANLNQGSSFTTTTFAPTVSLTSASETSNLTSVTLTGIADAQGAASLNGAFAELFDNGAFVENASISLTTGGFTFAPVTLPVANNTFTVQVTDNFGNTGTSNAVVDVVASQPPVITFDAHTGAGKSAGQTISGTVTLPDGASLVGTSVVLTEGTTTLGVATIGAGGKFSQVLNLPTEGLNNVTATVTDSYGNTGTGTWSYDLDNVAPTVTLSSSAEASNAATATLSGQLVSGGDASAVGQTVTIYDNGVKLGTTTTGAGGSFSYAAALSAGSNSLYAVASDSYGNQVTSATQVDTRDSVSPTVVITSWAESSNNATPTVTGYAVSSGAASVANVAVTILDGSTVIGTGTTDATGNFSVIPTTSLALGSNSITAVVADSYGNSGTSAAIVDKFNNVAPTVAITAPLTGSTNVALEAITGTVLGHNGAAVAGANVAIYDNGVYVDNAIVSASGTFNASVYLTTEGLNSLTAVVSDSYGNAGSTASATLVDLDNLAPTIAITSTAQNGNLALGATFAGQVVSGGDASVDGTKIVILDNTVAIATIATGSTGSFSFTDNALAAGSNSFTAVAYDSFGNKVTSAAQVDYNAGITGPKVALTSQAVSTNSATQTITGYAVSSDGASVGLQNVWIIDNNTLVIGSGTTDANGNFSVTAVLPPSGGSNSITAVVADSYGNIGTSAAIVDKFGTQAPLVTITAPVSGGTSNALEAVTGTVAGYNGAAVAGANVTIYDNGVAIDNAIVSASGTFNASLYLTTEGLNSLTAAVTDSYGNAGTSSATLVDLDNLAPTIAITSTAQNGNLALGATFAGQVVSGGDASVDGTKIVILDNTVAIATIATGSTGSFSFTDNALAAGSNSFTAVAYDSFGNKVTSAAQVDYNAGITGPKVTLTSQAENSNAALQTITGYAVSSDGASVGNQAVTILDGSTVIGTGTTDAFGNFIVKTTVPLAAGSNSITAKVADSYGNSGTSAAIVDKFGNQAPLVTITAPVSGGTNTALEAISGSVVGYEGAAVAGANVAIYDNGVYVDNAIVSASGTFNASVYLTTEGLNSLTATVTDSYGNVGGTAAATTVDLDNLAPIVTITSTAASGVLSAATFSGQVVSGGDASVDGTSVVILDNNKVVTTLATNSSGAFSFTDAALAVGTNSFTAVVSDSFGNTVTSAAQVDFQNATTTTITETQGNQSITPNGQTIINLFGAENTVTSSTGGLTIKGDTGNSTITLGGGNNTLVLGGYDENVTIDGNGNNAITGSLGGSTITVNGTGTQTVTAYGYDNTITLGNGDSTVSGLAGGTTVTVGNSATPAGGTITLGGTENVITTGGGNWTVTAGTGNSTINVGAANDAIKLNGAGDVINIGSGGATVTGVGYDTTYAMSDINGGLTVANFSVANNDVLDLTGIEHQLGATPYYVAASQDVTNHSALDIFVVTGTVGAYSVHEVASLNGVGGSTLGSLEANHTILA